MRLAVVSDFHGNLRALEAILDDLGEARPDVVVQGGDLALNGARPAEVIDRVRELGWEGVMGNADAALWGEIPESLPGPVRSAFERRAAATAELIGDERIGWLKTLPREWHGHGLGLVHAVPGDLWENVPPDVPDDRLREVYAGLGEPLAVYGHVHRPYVRDLGVLKVANSGSVGQPFDRDPRPSYLLVVDGAPAVRRVTYDVTAAAEEMRTSGFPDAEDLAASMLEARIRPPGMPGWMLRALRATGRI